MSEQNRPKTTPRARQQRLVEAVPPTYVNNELRFQRWRADQERRDREIDQAWEEHPPGRTLHVTASPKLPMRRRAGITFSNQGRTEVEVIDATEAEVLEIQATGATVVNPVGAKAIAEDTGQHGGLIVYDGPGGGSALAELSDEQLEAELKARRERPRTPAQPGDGRPQRLKRGEPAKPEDTKG